MNKINILINLKEAIEEYEYCLYTDEFSFDNITYQEIKLKRDNIHSILLSMKENGYLDDVAEWNSATHINL